MFEKIKGMMVDSLRIPEEKIPEDAILKDLGINSIDFADLIFQLEEEFNINNADSEFRNRLCAFGCASELSVLSQTLHP